VPFVVDDMAAWAASGLLLSLRISPVFALAPPFTLTRVPPLFRALFGLGIAACLASFRPDVARLVDLSAAALVATAARELMLGAVFVLAFQLAWGALYFAGRTVDVQAGFGMALLIDPTTRGHAPLVGTLFAYAAGLVFFAMDGHSAVLKLLAASLEAVPLAGGVWTPSLARLGAFLSVVFLTAFGVAGGAILCLFLADLAIAAMSRTVPQMNVLVLGFQVKTILLLLVLPASFGVSGALLARTATLTLEALPGLL